MKKGAFALITILIATGYFLYKKNTESEIPKTEKCCENCKEGKKKYYSIDTKHDKCGESCLRPSLVWLIKKFEPGMLLAENNNPCETQGYPIYTKTESHGFPPLKVNADFFEKEEPK